MSQTESNALIDAYQVENPERFGKVAVLCGGTANERSISLKSGEAVFKALQRQNIQCIKVDAVGQWWQTLLDESVTLVFNMMHGTPGEDGSVHGLLSLLNLPCTGPNMVSTMLAMDKALSKCLFEKALIPVPKGGVAKTLAAAQSVAKHLKLPLAVKPSWEGSSVGVSKVKTMAEFEAAFHLAASFSKPDVVIEEWQNGLEVFVGFIDDTALPLVAVKAATEFYDYEAKYQRQDTEYLCPAPLSVSMAETVTQTARDAYDALGCQGWGRVDCIVTENDEVKVIEVNTIPGMSESSLVPKAAAHLGWSFDELVVRIIKTAHEVPREASAPVQTAGQEYG